MSTSGSQSSDGGNNDPIPVPFNMHRGRLNPGAILGTFNLEMPSAGARAMPSFKQHEYPLVFLEIKDADQTDCLMRMKQLEHENILGIHFYDEVQVGDAKCIRAYIEPYTGCVSDLFQAEFFVNHDTDLVPSQPFQELVWASLQALDHIIQSGLYHGNFSWNTTLYDKQTDGKRILKLANFENKKNKSVLECQVGDCHALAHGLEEVSLYVRSYYADCKPETCILIDDLAHRLRAVTTESLSRMKEEHENDLFFWDDKRVRSFYAYEIPAVWDKPAFLESFKGSPSMPAMPWNTLWETDSFMAEMEIYRRHNGIKEYNFDELNDFIRFIAGLYTHEMALTKVPHRTLDAAVHEKHPRLLSI